MTGIDENSKIEEAYRKKRFEIEDSNLPYDEKRNYMNI